MKRGIILRTNIDFSLRADALQGQRTNHRTLKTDSFAMINVDEKAYKICSVLGGVDNVKVV
jgi:hypothetical protein